ncbi:hypothetical protein JJO83_08035 [Halomonas aquamarina]|nr:hypothetical protein [Halomonas aquamarina]MDC8442672.1 hypothetical protein [Halomonas aquamarina]
MITVLEERPAGAPSNGHGLSSPGHQPQHGVPREYLPRHCTWSWRSTPWT